jgi:proteasome lid subunit RPN8/RPN11
MHDPIPSTDVNVRALTPEILQKIYGALAPVYPAEGCGLVTEDRAGAPKVVVSENFINSLNALDPSQYSRRAENGYVLDTRLIVAAERAGETLKVIFHSHPDVGVYFSAEDTQKALVDWGDGPEPAYPDVDYLVVAVNQGKISHSGLFRYLNKAFVEIATFDANGERTA